MNISQNLVRTSRVMAWLSTAGFLIVPAIVIYMFLDPGHSQWLMFDMDHLGAELNGAVPLPFRLAALACALTAVVFTMWALWSLRQLFLRYAAGKVFSQEALRYLNNVAVALFAGVIVDFVMQAPISFLLTWSLGHGHREISLDLGSGDVATLFTAGVVLVIARVMREARRLADENESFV